MESQSATVESQLFDNVSSTTYTKPTGFDNNTNNHSVSKLDGSSGNDSPPRVGPAIILKVMAGDTITIGTYAWYQGTVQPPPTGATNLLNDLLNVLTGGVIGNSHGLYNTADNNPNAILSGDLYQFFTSKENTNYTTAAPKAFLNWVAFDNQLQIVDANSGVVQVPSIAGTEQAQPLVASEQVIQKNGYIYIYVSNESAQKVYFDNLVIHHRRGPILQENNYYPFGLTMAGISDRAALMSENNQLFNDGSKLQHGEFNDGTGLDWYATSYRNYDPQIGMFHSIDPMRANMISPYSYAMDNPAYFEDPTGAITMAAFQNIVDNLGNSPNGGVWSSGNGGGGGSYDYFQSESDAFVSGAFYNLNSGYGAWRTNPGGAYAGAYYNYVAGTGRADIPNYATFRTDFFQTLPEVTINEGNPNSLTTARSQIYEEVQQSLDDITNGKLGPVNVLGNIAGTAALTWDATRYGAIGAQMLGNAVGGASYTIQDIGKLRLARLGNLGEVTFEGAGGILNGAGMLLTGFDMYKNGVNWTNGMDLLMEGVTFVPVVGWAISGSYFISNFIVEHYTGQSIGQHLGNWYNTPIIQEGIHLPSNMPPTF